MDLNHARLPIPPYPHKEEAREFCVLDRSIGDIAGRTTRKTLNEYLLYHEFLVCQGFFQKNQKNVIPKLQSPADYGKMAVRKPTRHENGRRDHRGEAYRKIIVGATSGAWDDV